MCQILSGSDQRWRLQAVVKFRQMHALRAFLTPPTTAERSVAAALRIIMVYPARVSFFFSAIFSESSEPMDLKFGHDAWVGPEGDNKDFHRESFCNFLIKNQKPPQSAFPIVRGWPALLWVH